MIDISNPKLSLDELIMLSDAMMEYERLCAAQSDPELDDIEKLRIKLSMLIEAKRRAAEAL